MKVEQILKRIQIMPIFFLIIYCILPTKANAVCKTLLLINFYALTIKIIDNENFKETLTAKEV